MGLIGGILMHKLNNETEFIFSNEFNGFTTVPNYIFNYHNLSYRAIGIYCSILQFQNSPTHSITIKGLASAHKEGRDAVAKAIDELINAGFLEKIQIRDDGKFKGVLYKVYMKPIEYQRVEPITGKPVTEKPISENPSHKKKIDKKENLKKENKDDDTKEYTTEKKESSSSTTTVNEELISKVKEKWLEVTTKKWILSHANKIKLTELAKQFGEVEVVEALNNINNSDYLKEKITLTHFIQHFEKIARGEYNNHANIYVTAHSCIPNKISQFNNLGDNGRQWDWDEIDELERKRIDMRLNAQ